MQLKHLKKFPNPLEDLRRFKIFIENKHKIDEHNKLYDKGINTYKMGLNEFSDLLHDEFMAHLNGFKFPIGRR